MIRRPPRSTLSSSSAASDVYKRQTQYQCLRPPIARPVAPRMASTAPTTIRMIPRVHTMEILNTNPTISRMIPKAIMVCLFSFPGALDRSGGGSGQDRVCQLSIVVPNVPLRLGGAAGTLTSAGDADRRETEARRCPGRDTALVQDIEGGAGPVGVRVR